MERRKKFEESFRDAFDDAEVSPSENVWINVELDLEKADGGKMKRRLLFYKLLAAASVAFALAVTGIAFYGPIGGQNGPLAERKEHDNTANSAGTNADAPGTLTPGPAANSSTAGSASETASLPYPDHPASASSSSRADTESAAHPQVTAAAPSPSDIASAGTLRSEAPTSNQYLAQHTHDKNTTRSITDNSNNKKTDGITADGIAAGQDQNSETAYGDALLLKDSDLQPVFARNITIGKPELTPAVAEPHSNADPFKLMMARLADEEKAMQKDEKENDRQESLWTSVGMAAGGFNTVNGNVSSALTTLSSNSLANEQIKASGVTYSFGLSMGTKLSKRWVLQGGVNYLNQSSDYTATGFVGDSRQSFFAASVNNIEQLNAADAKQDAKYVPSTPYSVNNSLAFVSVPLQAGYLVLNNKFSIQLNAGLSTDLFLQNTVTPQGEGLKKETQKSGDDSPYRTVNFSGLAGTEFSYKVGQHYRIAINPGIRYPLNSIYKSDIGIEATPLTFDVGLNFRYIFH
ncbi:MAG TPA: outer membrane beta-barrel protein [Ohtaekwangia sp.]|nr:outer membrane beta-barrel protein [Ohtaekwangia sp.]